MSRRPSCRLGISPVVGFDTPFHRVENGLHCEPLLKGRAGVLTLANALEQIVDCVGKRVLVADNMTCWPPVRSVWMHPLGDVDGAEPLQARGVILKIDLQLVHTLEVERDRPLRSVDLEAVVVAPPRRQPRRLERATGPALEAGQEGRRIVDGDLPHLRPRLGHQTRATAGVRRYRTLIDEGR